MRPTWKTALIGVAAAAVLAAPSAARAAGCGDLNNDGNRTTADAIMLSQCIANGGTCPAVTPGPLCGTGNLADCGDLFGDGDVSFPVGQNADLAVLLQSLAGLSSLYDICEGPGPNVTCPGGVATLGTQTITASQTWPKACTVKLNGTVFVDHAGGHAHDRPARREGVGGQSHPRLRGSAGADHPARRACRFPGHAVRAHRVHQ